MRKPVVIVGGGIFGMCVLDALSRRGVPAHLVEQSELAGGATGHSGGMLRRWHAAPELVELASQSMPFWAELGYQRTGSLYFELPNAEKPELPANAEWLTGAEGAERFPQLTWTPADRAIYEADGGWADPRTSVRKLAQRARQRGAQISTFRRVTSAAVTPAGPWVRLDDEGQIEASAVVWATGPFDSLYSPGPSANRLIQVIALNGRSPGTPCFLDRASRGFLRNSGDQLWIGVGLESEASGPAPVPLEPDDAARARAAVGARLPAVQEWLQVGGVRTADRYLPTRIPYFGPAAESPGHYLATGGSGAGFKVAPALAERLAEQICRSA